MQSKACHPQRQCWHPETVFAIRFLSVWPTAVVKVDNCAWLNLVLSDITHQRKAAPHIFLQRGWRICIDDSESRNENDNRHSDTTLKTKISPNLLAEETVENSQVEPRDVTPVVSGKESFAAPSESKGEATEQGSVTSVY